MTNLQKLTELQNKIGYVAGEIHPVALLGLLGETGEVAAETTFTQSEHTEFHEMHALWEKTNAINRNKVAFALTAESLDLAKKEIRRETDSKVVVFIKSNNFDIELADLFYYLNAVAIARGLTIEDLARMSYEKVIARRGVVKDGDPAK
jgi:hypothetical protein